jgi:hypothetical protein
MEERVNKVVAVAEFKRDPRAVSKKTAEAIKAMWTRRPRSWRSGRAEVQTNSGEYRDLPTQLNSSWDKAHGEATQLRLPGHPGILATIAP